LRTEYLEGGVNAAPGVSSYHFFITIDRRRLESDALGRCDIQVDGGEADAG
jgi:hypothetical protein